MSKGIILSEDPKDHWKHLNTKDGIVLDLGCGFNDDDCRNKKYSTPHYFKEQGASLIVGVDGNASDIELLRQEIDGEFIAELINSGSQIQGYISKYKPTHLKCDIEGNETFLFQTDPMTLRCVAVETHGPQYRQGLNDWLNRWGFSVYSVESLASAPYIDIVYAQK